MTPTPQPPEPDDTPADPVEVVRFFTANDFSYLPGFDLEPDELPIGFTVRDNQIVFFVNCSDRFAWATADAEPITQHGFQLLQTMWTELDMAHWWETEDHLPFEEFFVLWCARIRNIKPMPPYLTRHATHPELFDDLPDNTNWT